MVLVRIHPFHLSANAQDYFSAVASYLLFRDDYQSNQHLTFYLVLRKTNPDKMRKGAHVDFKVNVTITIIIRNSNMWLFVQYQATTLKVVLNFLQIKVRVFLSQIPLHFRFYHCVNFNFLFLSQALLKKWFYNYRKLKKNLF